ncbi:class I SAM-dependent methyltransferase [Haloplasma contractile]|uniref:Ubiquinone-menaquinone biosynthesis methyltransferase protein n=1 Tax=Haloplasma contractile SSD-17B TaxID=1033810 RepID=U2FIH1_9MOLU|nr:class I SAM-dependent methyltransferase [Haloplasma contractile]ERJ11014.1 ubiquinone-menaquinone biosynthesis methyltransferase protein [Haloplasma contractile SSD-17B]
MTIGNYEKYATLWDWSGYDRTEEFEFWSKMASHYGNKVLSPMAAIGEVGAYMSNNGFNVTVSDLTREMVAEGHKRYGHLPNIEFIQADVRYHNFTQDIFDFAFIGSTDLHHLQTIEDVRMALQSIHHCLKPAGGLGLELWYPSNQ